MAAVEIGPIDGVAVLGGGTAFPERQLTNDEVLARLGGRARAGERLRFVADGMRESLGVERRAWAHLPGTPLDHEREESTVDLAVAAARAALAQAGVAASELGLVLCATSTPHRMTGTVAAALGAALGARTACVDLRAGCAAALFGLITAALHLQAGSAPVLLVGAETFSKVIPPDRPLAALALGDGAGAIVLGVGPGRLRSAFFASDGALGRLVRTDGPLPPTAEAIAAGGYLLAGDADELMGEIPRRYEEAIGRALARAGVGPGDIDLYVPHQTSRSLIEDVCARVGLVRERAFISLERHANVGAAGWLVALVLARAEGRVPAGSRLLLASVGGGMSWAAAVLEC